MCGHRNRSPLANKCTSSVFVETPRNEWSAGDGPVEPAARAKHDDPPIRVLNPLGEGGRVVSFGSPVTLQSKKMVHVCGEGLAGAAEDLANEHQTEAARVRSHGNLDQNECLRAVAECAEAYANAIHKYVEIFREAALR